MKVTPVTMKSKPIYPNKQDVTSKELGTAIPKRWLVNSAAKMALSALIIVSLAGCASQKTESELAVQQEIEEQAVICTPEIEMNGEETVIVDDEELVVMEVTDGLPAPPKTVIFFKDVIDKIVDFLNAES